MPVRVQLGKLPGGDYGLRVVSSDGSTVIIDGTSNMFKIAASGTFNGTAADGFDGHATSVNLDGLGALPAVPAHVGFVAVGNTVLDLRGTVVLLRTKMFAALTSGGSPTADFMGVEAYTRIVVALIGGDICQVVLAITNYSGVSITHYGKYYVLAEAAM